ncbi:hypothetical protein A3860_19010 [Niastella vici]|uniref:DUF5689 domain-containing protein n=1 Tax=Niastella vici TaxID=1703345 RepID=A0A1V9G309_9BACT|nr:hypothetical protein [Niastella vici]OQP64846.1 hypothetical protein A3860_19010 [Niastella vici]
MKASLLSAAILATAIVSVTACKKDKSTPNYAKADDFMASHAIKEQSFSGNAAAGFTITGKDGTKVTFSPNAFVDGNGNVVSGNVTVTLKEVLSKKDVLFSGVMTESNGQLLESGGEILVKAQKDGADLRINPALQNDGARVEIPKAMNKKDMGLFVQDKRQQGGATGGNQPQQSPYTWNPAPYYPFGNGPNSYSFSLPSFTWVNCDRFYSDPNPKTTITALPAFQDNNQVTDLQVMLVFKNITTVITLPYDFTVQKFQSYQNSLPIGLQADLIIIGKDSDGYIQFGTQPITISANMHIDAPIHKATQAEVDAFLATI